MKRFAAVVVVLAAAACAAPPAPAAETGTLWRNERGSELRVDTVVDGRLTGAFRSSVGRVDEGTWYPATGFVRGDVVGFVVDFGTAGSVAAWSGQIDGDRMATQWHLSRDVADADEAAELWSSVLSGADTFRRVR